MIGRWGHRLAGIGELPKEVLIIVGVIPVMVVTTVAARSSCWPRPAGSGS